MAISKPKTLKYDLFIKELDKTIQYRGMKHGDQKVLLMALELKDESAIINAILDIIDSCTFGSIDKKNTPMSVMDYIFLKIYIATIGNQSPVLFTCGGTKIIKDDEGNEKEVPCGLKLNMNLNLDDAKLEYPEGYEASKLIEVDPDISLKLKSPDFETYRKFDSSASWTEAAEKYVWSGLEAIIDHGEVKVPSVDFTIEELKEFLDALEPKVFEEIGAYFEKMPELVLEHSVKCPSCGRSELFRLRGLDAFLG